MPILYLLIVYSSFWLLLAEKIFIGIFRLLSNITLSTFQFKTNYRISDSEKSGNFQVIK